MAIIKKKKNNENLDQPREKILEIDASMQGTLSFKDPVNIMINGNFEGNLDTLGILTVGAEANVKAKINGDVVILKGEVVGDVVCKKSLQLSSTARLIGDVKTPELSMEQGAILQGKLDMIGSKSNPREEVTKTFLDAEELASYLSVEKSLVFEWADSGRLPGKRNGSSWSFDKKKVDEWIASGKIK